ncbi:MAG: hypothetical protein DRP12_03205 [Candidatus Aenigmatarchaeota archaeon]|nr:MAG: hypothetical protein DRP12_03205 [Candidatus Aenigmarchaeota archaeon]
MLLALLGFLDILVGIFLIFKIGFLFWFGIVWVLKGLWSVISSAGSGFWLDFLGWLDILAGGACLAVSFGLEFWIFFWLGVAMVLKGLYSLVMGIS